MIGNSGKDYCTMHYSEQVNSDNPMGNISGWFVRGPKKLGCSED